MKFTTNDTHAYFESYIEYEGVLVLKKIKLIIVVPIESYKRVITDVCHTWRYYSESIKNPEDGSEGYQYGLVVNLDKAILFNVHLRHPEYSEVTINLSELDFEMYPINFCTKRNYHRIHFYKNNYKKNEIDKNFGPIKIDAFKHAIFYINSKGIDYIKGRVVSSCTEKLWGAEVQHIERGLMGK